MSLAAASTNINQAEYLSLVTGLAVADRHHWRPLEVMGDSRLIVRQLERYRPPKTADRLQYSPYTERPASSQTRSAWKSDITTSAHITRWRTRLPTLLWTADAVSNPFTRPLAPNGQGSTTISSATSSTGGLLPATAASYCILGIAVHSDVTQYYSKGSLPPHDSNPAVQAGRH